MILKDNQHESQGSRCGGQVLKQLNIESRAPGGLIESSLLLFILLISVTS